MTETDQDYGSSTPVLLAKFDRDTLSWKTWQPSLFGGLIEFLEPWPRSGMTVSTIASPPARQEHPTGATDYGSLLTRVYALPTLVPLKNERQEWPTVMSGPATLTGGSGVPKDLREKLWATPNARDWKDGINPKMYEGRSQPLPRMVAENERKMWQTPTAEDSINRTLRGEPKLSGEVKLWPIPRSVTAMAATITQEALDAAPDRFPNLETIIALDQASDPNSTPVGGSLNPTWTEWLMGFPLSWTALKEYPFQVRRQAKILMAKQSVSKVSETPSSRKSRKSSATLSLSTIEIIDLTKHD